MTLDVWTSREKKKNQSILVFESLAGVLIDAKFP